MACIDSFTFKKDEYGEFVEFSLSNKPEMFFTCDKEDFDFACTGFYAHKCSSGNSYYLERKNDLGKFISFHREILRIPESQKHLVSDHIDRNTQNNRKYNLRAVTVRENNLNRLVTPMCFLKEIEAYFGRQVVGLKVSWIKKRGYYQIYVGDKYVGSGKNLTLLFNKHSEKIMELAKWTLILQ